MATMDRLGESSAIDIERVLEWDEALRETELFGPGAIVDLATQYDLTNRELAGERAGYGLGRALGIRVIHLKPAGKGPIYVEGKIDEWETPTQDEFNVLNKAGKIALVTAANNFAEVSDSLVRQFGHAGEVKTQDFRVQAEHGIATGRLISF